MSELIKYNWTRFWCSRGGAFALTDDGFLTDPEGEYGKYLNPTLVSTESLHQRKCAVLLGEPGLGKSVSIGTLLQKEMALSDARGDRCLLFDLREYGSEDRFVREVFENTAIQSWIGGNGLMHLFLDSLDECLMRIVTLSAILASRLSKLPVDRLRLRIACRTADWPSALEESLLSTWALPDVEVYELLPLRRIDVETTLTAIHISDPARFFDEVERLRAAPLAIKPITLNFLINTYLRDGNFPSSQIELYLKGCKILCEEPSRRSRDVKVSGSLSADERLTLAMRIAAVTVFANRYAIWTGKDVGNIPTEDIALRELMGGSELCGDRRIAVTEEAIKEVLGTGLFSSRGSDRMGWAHQTYAEFLAARYLAEQEFSANRIEALISHSGEINGKLVPQLSQTSAWLGRMVPQVFERIVRSDPDLFLLSDVAVGSAADRMTLTRSLLALAEDDKLLPYDPRIRSHLQKLQAPDLTRQLKPYIDDQSRGHLARHLAIDMAEACHVIDLADSLANVALDSGQKLDIRVNAAHAVARVGTHNAKKKLLPLAVELLTDDPDDELKGCALRSAWPTFLNADKMFSVLTARKNDGLFGAYWSFLERELPDQLRPEDLSVALDWLMARSQARDGFGELSVAIVLLAWDNLDDETIAYRLAELIVIRLRLHYELFPPLVSHSNGRVQRFSKELASNPRKRQILLSALIRQVKDPNRDVVLFLFGLPSLACSEDVPWFLDLLVTSTDLATKTAIAELIQRTANWRDRTQFDVILMACDLDHVLSQTLTWLVKPVDLHSPAAKQMKAQYLQEKEFERRRNEKLPPLDPPPYLRIQRDLDAIEAGDSEGWVQLSLNLTLKPDSGSYETPFNPNLRNTPGWNSADAPTRARILSAALQYLISHVPIEEEWLGKSVFHWKDFSGYKALQLLFEESPSLLNQLDSQVWSRWATVILVYPTYSEAEEAHR